MLRLRTLGAVDLRDPLGRPVREVLSRPKRIALLIYLVVEGSSRSVRREELHAIFWPESDEERARNGLSQSLYHLRQVLGADVIVGGRGTVLDISLEALGCDAVDCAEAIARGEVERALDLHQGAFCPALVADGAPAFEEWASGYGRRLRRQLIGAARTAVDRPAGADDEESAARIARRALALVPDDERDVRRFLGVLESSGDPGSAVRAYDEYVERLRADLDTEPSAETRGLAEAMRARQRTREPARAGTVRTPLVEAVAANASPPSADAPIPGRSRRRPKVGLAVAGVLVTALLAMRFGNLELAGRSPAVAPRAVAVFPFAVHGGEAAALLGDGMPDLLAMKLDGLPSIQAIDPRSSVAAAGGRAVDAAQGDALARELGARFFVLGEVTQVGGDVELNGNLYEVGRGARSFVTASARGDTTSVFRVVEQLAGQLLAGVYDDRDTTMARLAAVTSSSLPAVKAYLRGERALRAGLDAQAASAFREAVQYDSTFAFALYRLALVATWIRVPDVEDPAAWAAAAARHAEHLTPIGRDLLEAYRAYKELDPRSEERYRAIVQSHPDNVEAWFMLGEVRFHYGPFAGRSPFDARSAFERVLVLDPTHSHALLHLARLAAMEGRADELDAIAARFGTAATEPLRTLEVRALQAWVHRDGAAAALVVREAGDADAFVASSLASAAASFALDLDAARPIAERLARPGHPAFATRAARMMLADLGLAAGKVGEGHDGTLSAGGSADWQLESEALMAAEPAFGLSPAHIAAVRARLASSRPYRTFGVGSAMASEPDGARFRLHLLALLSRRLGDEAGARRYDAERVAMDRGSSSDLVHLLDASERAEVARAANRPSDALAELERVPFGIVAARPAHVGVRERFARAEVLVALDRDAEALPWFESIGGAYDLPFLAIAQLRQGGIHERAGRRARAAECYRRALALWHAADAELAPLVDEARAGLARSR